MCRVKANAFMQEETGNQQSLPSFVQACKVSVDAGACHGDGQKVDSRILFNSLT
jgi:hypothetical protein